MENQNQKETNLGALWIKVGKNGEYLSGVIEVDGVKISIVCFKNGYKKENDNQPNYRIFQSRPQNQATPDAQNTPQTSQTPQSASNYQSQQNDTQKSLQQTSQQIIKNSKVIDEEIPLPEENSSDIPF